MLKQRVVQIQPDAAFMLDHSQGASGFGGPGHRSLQGCCGSGFVQPALIVWNHCGGANDSDTRLRPFHQNMRADGARKPWRALHPTSRRWSSTLVVAASNWGQGKRHQRKEPRKDAKVLNMTLNTVQRET